MVTQGITTQRQRELIDRLKQLVARRAREESEIRQRYASRDAEARQAYQRHREEATARFEDEHARLIAGYNEARESIVFRYESEGFALVLEEARFNKQLGEQQSKQSDEASEAYERRCRQLQTSYLENETTAREELSKFAKQCEDYVAECDKLTEAAQKVVTRRTPWPDDAAEPPLARPGFSERQLLESAVAEIARGNAKLIELRNLPAARFLEDGWPVLVFIFGGAAAIYPLWLLLGSWGWGWVAAGSLLVAVILAIAARLIALPLARQQTLRVVPEFQQAVIQARADLAAAQASAQVALDRALQRLARQRDELIAQAGAEAEKFRQAQATSLESRTRDAATEFAAKRDALEARFERELQKIEDQYPRQISALERQFEQQIARLGEAHRQQRAEHRQQFEAEMQALLDAWTQGLAEIEQAIDGMTTFAQLHFPRWESIDWQTWEPTLPAPAVGDGEADDGPIGYLPALCFGRYDFELDAASETLPPTLELPRSRFELPAVLSYPESPSLLIKAEGDGRDAATSVIQSVMLRLLTSFAPGKVRFTIIDPVGLGQNFSAFMHLADYDERLVSNRIWTESGHINQRLADLTEHMENVIQKYLRNEFSSIQEYNQQAGEVAEPFQILVVANFPANFSDEAARRLVSIASSGARCGVYTLISVDSKLKLPRNFDLADLEAHATTLEWSSEQQRFCFQHDDLRGLPLEVESPPDDETFTTIVRSVGRLAKEGARVEVPFEQVTPPPEQWWTGDSRGTVEVPLGRAGARKLQYMRLGKGTSQHVLIAGKTGSGKSTLLNAMITNLALHYSPHELQFYLIDFKKGVEFKAYAALELPHARVVAIESEREFGLSVLERLDLELKRRGDLFRQIGVQNLEGYRNAEPAAVMPRILLIIDEFQEFFTTDDKISHDASLLLDRLVRQGRAFGIHVLLGSQTLAGAYSLARSTIGQMAVRIALQCSEADSHLILSEDNTAARLLSRPGEAIYNDANGLFEGNHPFQVVWLSDQQRESYLSRVRDLMHERGLVLPKATIFEGNVAADPSENEMLHEVLTQPAAAEVSFGERAWLGAAVAIKEPTNVLFRRQGGSNLLIVGQQEELALGMMTSALVSIAGQLPVATPSTPSTNGADDEAPPQRFYILDGSRPESAEATFWPRLLHSLPLDAQVVSPRQAADCIRKLAEEVDRRLNSTQQSAAPIYLLIYNLSRFRDLKKSDDFSFSSFGDEESTSVDKQLATILREGPSLGVHAIVWCDSFNNVNRWFDRQTLRELDLRVLMQMSATDSSNLMDSPAASRLGPHLSILYSEEQGTSEKFRPYGLPSATWLAWVQSRLTSRAAAEGPSGAALSHEGH